ncbi:hypothetical protein J3Q64DRAFT_1694906 [Phycomyces blakesleeanus]|uniref:Uncharacterized protein n=2 Tax=Phycomyces blakesleeanus TaxID=4837 RepID=A0A162Y6V9_PHYB8|nr:hypothetical protein PHYBLDRAFT_163749 [Phycomyces blakesleeanus NRRL 1555(-)]OAD78655.1 hypothetical protein PHYBLDRAFT_163749 [Phycomyces blakesleeanus NRRL 1555(-)]|eukprot:XP_018296695.1 hypothetical protein PHYBLDRAFT_163749 [Phycomyces blakesleeanus NRRL 1555(-)]
MTDCLRYHYFIQKSLLEKYGDTRNYLPRSQPNTNTKIMFTPVSMPATCEMCGNWLPEHSSECPRNGVHPSQWALSCPDDFLLSSFDLDQDIIHNHHISFAPQTSQLLSASQLNLLTEK